MAYKRYKRIRAKTVRKRPRYSRRYYRRRARKYRSYYRRGRRFPKTTEVKSVSFTLNHRWDFNQELANENVDFYPGVCSILPFPSTNGYTVPGIDIAQGTSQSQRIGNKVSPIKMRFSGTLSLDREFSSSTILPQSFHVRLLVYQVRGGNAGNTPSSLGYHPLAVGDTNGLLDAYYIAKLLNYYAYTDSARHTFTPDQMRQNMAASKTPLRLGIGGQFRMLYTKTFVLSDQHVSTKPFRIVTKVPRRLVWPEKSDGAKDSDPKPGVRNAIFAVWIVVPQTANPVGTVHLNYQTQLFYIDK